MTMNIKRKSVTLGALFKAQKNEHNKIRYNPDQDFTASLERIKGLKLEHKTKMEIGTETNRKVMMLSKVLGVNGYALVDVAVNEFLERNRMKIDNIMKHAMK